MMTRAQLISTFGDFIKDNNLTVSELLIIVELIIREISARGVITKEDLKSIIHSISQLK